MGAIVWVVLAVLIGMLILGGVLVKSGFVLGWVPIALVMLFVIYTIYKVLE